MLRNVNPQYPRQPVACRPDQTLLFSVVTVALNAGAALADTVKSILAQTYENYELIVKDGLSCDGSVEALPQSKKLRIIRSNDAGIYDAMNQALAACRGRYVIFLNAGDGFTMPMVLGYLAKTLEESGFPEVAYMNFKNMTTGLDTHYRSSLTPFYLYRRFICHQAQVIRHDCFERFGGYDTDFRILADVDFFARLVVGEKLRPLHVPITGVYYDGAGVSETAALRPIFHSETRRFRMAHYRPLNIFWYGLATRITFPGTRMWLLQRCRWPWLLKIYWRSTAIFR